MISLKGQSQAVGTVLLAAVTISAVGVVLDVSDDVFDETEDLSTIQTATEYMNAIDDNIRAVSAEGEGSTRVEEIPIDDGSFHHHDEEDIFYYQLETSAEPISPQTASLEGEALLANNARVTVEEDEPNDCIKMENERTTICINSEGTEEDPVDLSNEELIEYYEVEGEEREFDFDLWINDDEGTSTGDTWTTAEEGAMLPRGEVRVHKSLGGEAGGYLVQFVLYSGADFVSIRTSDLT